jgi:ribonuclease-3 family protein
VASEIELLDSLKDQFNLGEKDPKSYSPLVLAYVGDCIYEMIIRTVLVHKRDSQVQKLHKEATWFVKAATQAMIIEKLMPLLTEEEQDVYRRGKNAKSHTAPKNADLGDYHKATGFEALAGYLYLSHNTGRLIDLVKIALEDEFEKQ